MRRLGHPITVAADAAGQPRQLDLPSGSRRVQAVLDEWVEAGRWWEGEPVRRFWRVEADGVFDLSRDPDGVWRVEVAWD